MSETGAGSSQGASRHYDANYGHFQSQLYEEIRRGDVAALFNCNHAEPVATIKITEETRQASGQNAYGDGRP